MHGCTAARLILVLQMREQLRTAARRCRLPSLELDRRVVLDVLNVVFALTERSMHFWTQLDGVVTFDGFDEDDESSLVPAKRAILDKFGSLSLESNERSPDFDLRYVSTNANHQY